MAGPFVAGVDLGGTKIQVVAVNGTAVKGGSRTATPTTSAEHVVHEIVGSVRLAVQQAGGRLSGLDKVGIGTPGRIDGRKGVVSHSGNVVGMMDPFALGPAVSKELGGLPVVIDNDVRVAILGEYERGAGRHYKNVLGVFVGTGVGGGLVLEGKLREGRGAAGEIGHTLVKPGGRLCSCGRRGCLEAYAGRGCIEATARRWQAKKRMKTELFEIMADRRRDRLTSGVIAAALERKDKMAEKLIDEAIKALGIARPGGRDHRRWPGRPPGQALRRQGRRGGPPAPPRPRQAPRHHSDRAGRSGRRRGGGHPGRGLRSF